MLPKLAGILPMAFRVFIHGVRRMKRRCPERHHDDLGRNHFHGLSEVSLPFFPHNLALARIPLHRTPLLPLETSRSMENMLPDNLE